MSQRYREVGEAAWRWVLAQVHQDDGPWLPEAVPESPLDAAGEAGPGEDRDTLYAGVGGLPLVLAKIERSRALTETEQALATEIGARLRTSVPGCVEPSLYLGLAGDVTALRALTPGGEQGALQRLAELTTPSGWVSTLEMEPGSSAPVTDLVLGTAGVVLAAVWAGGERARTVALAGGEALLTLAEPTPAGLDWGMLPTSTSRGPNYSHGTAGIAAALAIAGQTLGREDFVDAAQRGAVHLLSLGSLDDGGFVVPHTVPPSTRKVEPVTYTWCHGPTGTSHLFSALAQAGVAEVAGLGVAELRRRCLYSVVASGVPQRLRPGFWDNDGRCCGTAGVGDVLLDAAQDCADPAGRGLAAVGPGGGRPGGTGDRRRRRGSMALPGASPGPAAAAAGHLLDAGRRRDRGVPVPPGPGDRPRTARAGRGSARPVVGRSCRSSYPARRRVTGVGGCGYGAGMVIWQLTVDAVDPERMAAFWGPPLGYVLEPAPRASPPGWTGTAPRVCPPRNWPASPRTTATA